MSDISLSQLLQVGIHYGHEVSQWNPKMLSYIYGEIDNIHILNVTKSLLLLKEANNFVKLEAHKGKTFLFVSTKEEIAPLIAEEARRCNSHYVNSHWLGGMITNWQTIKNQVERLKNLERQNPKDFHIKKEKTAHKKDLDRLYKYFSGVKTMTSLPDIAIIIDQKQEIAAINECRKLKIPIVSLLDTDCDPDLIDIPIPGNDDSAKSIKMVLNSLTNSIIEGQSKFIKNVIE